MSLKTHRASTITLNIFNLAHFSAASNNPCHNHISFSESQVSNSREQVGPLASIKPTKIARARLRNLRLGNKIKTMTIVPLKRKEGQPEER